MKNNPVVLLWDLETAPMITATFSLYPERIDHTHIIQDWFIISASWKLLGKSGVQSLCIKKEGDDYELVKKLREVILGADLLVHQNGDRFDVKKLNARLIYHKLPPLPQIPTCDTLKEIKKIAGMSSNRLDYLGHYLIGQRKMETERGLWLRAMKGDKTALKKMVAYCNQDVLLLESVYMRLRPYMKTHAHIGVLRGHDRDVSCRKCGGTHMNKRGLMVTASGHKQQRYQCLDCGSWSSYPLKNRT